MDPNECLKQIRALAKHIVSDNDADCTESGPELAELVLALDQWIKSGGFLPAQWTAGFAK